MGNEVVQASERKSLIITPFGAIFFHPTSCSQGGAGGGGGGGLRSEFGAIGIRLSVC